MASSVASHSSSSRFHGIFLREDVEKYYKRKGHKSQTDSKSDKKKAVK